MYVREGSGDGDGDSKYFEKETLHPVCRLLWQYARRKPDDEMADEILEDYHIWREPKKLCLKGAAVIYVGGKSVDVSLFPGGIELLAADLDKISRVDILVPEFMTIENRTSYLRYHDDQTVTFYLGGYGDRYQRDLLKMVIAANPHVCYKHFGDIDAGGFLIHQQLCKMTGVNFKLFSMSVKELKNPRYAPCLHPLTDNDRVRLLNLKNRTPYEEVVSYMLDHNIKLEQEMISLDLMT